MIRKTSEILFIFISRMGVLFANLIKFIFWKKSKNYYGVLLIFLLGFFLRLVGTYPGYPFTNPDEPTITDGARQMILYKNFKPGNYYYGFLLSIIYALVNLFFFIPFFFASQFVVHFQNIIKYGFPSFFHDFYVTLQIQNNISYWARYETAVISSLTVIVMYLIGKRLFNSKVGFVVAFLTAVNYRHVASSRFALADAPAALFAGLALLFIINIIRKPTLRNYLLAGIVIGLALSVKYFIYVIFPFLLAHMYVVLKQKKIKFISKLKNIFIDRKVLFACVVFSLVFFAINPYLLLDFKEASWQLSLNAHRYGLVNPFSSLLVFLNGSQTHFVLFPIRYLLWYGLGWLLIVLIIAGYLYALTRYFKKTIFISAVVLPFLFVFLILSKHAAFVRNYASIIPFLLFFPSILIVDISRLIKNKNISIAIIFLLVFIISFTSFKDSLLSSLYFSKDHNIVLTTRWIDENLKNKLPVNIAVTGDFPNIYTVNIAKTFIVNPRGKAENMSIDELIDKDIDWAILGSNPTALKNAELWSNNKNLIIDFFNKEKMANFLRSSYTGLALSELGDYRVAEFVKPFWQSNETGYFIAKIPRFSKENRKIIKTYSFGSDNSINNLSFSSFEPCNFYKLMYISGEEDEIPSIKIGRNLALFDSAAGCDLETKLMVNEPFKVEENKWYKIEGLLKRIGNPKYMDSTNGFIRLDFYSSENKIIKTHVSSQLQNINDWQTISSSGLAPVDSKYARISFQLDQYYEEEEYLISNLSSYLYERRRIDLSQYPYYGKSISENFYWLLEL